MYKDYPVIVNTLWIQIKNQLNLIGGSPHREIFILYLYIKSAEHYLIIIDFKMDKKNLSLIGQKNCNFG